MNTHIQFLMPAEQLPKDGEWVPYLFGQADRWHIVKEVTVMADYMLRNRETGQLVHYFDGARLKRITVDQACEIARNYRRSIEDQFYNQTRRRA